MSLKRAMRMTIDSCLENVALVGTAMRGILSEEPGPAEDIPLVELALCEAVNNAIIHAYGGRRDQTVEIDIALEDDTLTLCVVDRGKSFEHFPESLPDMPDGERLDDIPLGGWGLRIMGAVMRSVRYRQIDGRNELCMSRPWSADCPPFDAELLPGGGGLANGEDLP